MCGLTHIHQVEVAGVGGRRFRNEDAFIIRHFAADVCYQTKGWLSKNNDGIHADLMGVLKVRARHAPYLDIFVFNILY